MDCPEEEFGSEDDQKKMVLPRKTANQLPFQTPPIRVFSLCPMDVPL